MQFFASKNLGKIRRFFGEAFFLRKVLGKLFIAFMPVYFLMNSDLLNLGSAVIFYGIVLLLVYKNRAKFQKYYGVMFLYRMKVGLKAMQKFGEKYSSIIKIFATVGVIMSVYFIFLLPKMFFDGAVKIFTTTNAPAQVTLLIPGVHVPGSPFFVPFWYGIISLIIIAFIHEAAHGVTAAAEGVKPKHDGVGFLFFIPLFFVEPDEKKLLKKPIMTRLRIIAAGPSANILTAAIVLLFLNYALAPVIAGLFASNGVLVTSLMSGYPAKNSGLASGDVITMVNSTHIQNSTSFVDYLEKTSPNQTLVIGTTSSNYTLTLTTNPSNSSEPFMGVTFTDNVVKTSKGVNMGFVTDILLMFSKLLTWIAFLSIGIGVMNFLPVWAVDGGQIFYNLSLYFVKNEKRAAKLSSAVFWIVLILLLLNLFGPFLGV